MEKRTQEKKTQDPPSQTEGGAPSVWMRGIFSGAVYVCGSIVRERRIQESSGPPAQTEVKDPTTALPKILGHLHLNRPSDQLSPPTPSRPLLREAWSPA